MKRIARLYYGINTREHTNPNKGNYSVDAPQFKGFNQYGDATAFLIEHGFAYKSYSKSGNTAIEIWEKEGGK
jgi:hypothetical protein